MVTASQLEEEYKCDDPNDSGSMSRKGVAISDEFFVDPTNPENEISVLEVCLFLPFTESPAAHQWILAIAGGH